MSDKKILMVLTSHATLGNTGKTTGFYVSEASHPYDVFVHQAGYSVDLVSPQGGEPPRDGEDNEDVRNQTFLDEMAGKLAHTAARPLCQISRGKGRVGLPLAQYTAIHIIEHDLCGYTYFGA